MINGRLRARLLLSLLLGLAAAIGLAGYGDFSKVGGALGHFRWEFIPVILALTLFNYALRFLKWHYYLGVAGIRGVGFWDSFNFFFAGLAMTVTPAKIGEWLKSYLLRERYGAPISQSAPIVMAERVTDGYGMIILSLAGLVLFHNGWIFMLVVTLIGVAIAGMFRYRPVQGLTLQIAARTPVVKRHVRFIEEFFMSAFTLFSPKVLLISVLLGVVSWLGEGIAMYYVLRGLGMPHSTELVVQGVFILSTTTLAGAVLLLPGGLGVAEGGITGLSQVLVGLSKEAAAAGTLIIRICTLWFGVAAGLVALLILAKRLPNARFEPEKRAGAKATS